MPPQDASLMTDNRPATDPVFVLGIVSVILVLVTWAILSVMASSHSRQSEVYTTKINELKIQANEYKATEATYRAVETVVAQASALRSTQYLFGPTWKSLKEAVPKDVQFLTLSMGNDYVFRVAGVTKSVTAVAQFSRQLEKVPGVSVVTPLSIEKQTSGSVYNFNLSFRISPTATNGAQ